MGKSHQRGWVVARGKKWYGYYRRTVLDPVTNAPVTDVVTIVLGLKARLTKSEAREELQKEIAQQTGQHVNGRVMKDGSIAFGWFVRNRYLPLREANWKPETAKVKKIQIQRDLVEKFENVPMDAIDKFMLQTHINRLARFCSTDRVLQARSYLKSIFSEAVEQDFLQNDPSHKVTAPLNLRKKDKTVLTWDQLRLVLATLTHRDRVLLTLEMTEALRPSELFALRWRSLEGSKLTITETVYKGKIRPWGKTRRSLGDVHLPAGLANELWLWKQECPDPSPDAFIFLNVENVFLPKQIDPACPACELAIEERVIIRAPADLGDIKVPGNMQNGTHSLQFCFLDCPTFKAKSDLVQSPRILAEAMIGSFGRFDLLLEIGRQFDIQPARQRSFPGNELPLLTTLAVFAALYERAFDLDLGSQQMLPLIPGAVPECM